MGLVVMVTVKHEMNAPHCAYIPGAFIRCNTVTNETLNKMLKTVISQSYGIHHQEGDEIELLTYVDYIAYGGPAYLAGMRQGNGRFGSSLIRLHAVKDCQARSDFRFLESSPPKDALEHNVIFGPISENPPEHKIHLKKWNFSLKLKL